MSNMFALRITLFAVLLAATACDAAGGTATPAPPAATATTAAIVQPTIAPTALPAAPTITAATRAPLATAAQPTSATTSAPAATTTPTTPAGPTGNPFDIIIAAQRAQLAAKSFRVRTTTTTANGATTTSVVEYVNPDRIHLIQANGMETIVIKGVGTYTKTGGTWVKAAFDLSSTVFAQFDPKTIEDLQKSVVTDQVKLVGPDLIDGKPMLVFTYNTVVKALGPGGSDIHGTAKLWLGATDSLPYRRESEQDSAVTKGEKTKTVSVYEYDAGIKIEKPI